MLGVAPESNEDEIKKAYRKLALKFHPDKNSDADAEDRFKEIAEAYEILTDPKRRSIYDQFGEEGGFLKAHNWYLHSGFPYSFIVLGLNFEILSSLVFSGLKNGVSGAAQGKGFRNHFHGDPHATFSDHFDSFFGCDVDGEDDLFNPFRRFPFSHVNGFAGHDGGHRRGQGKEVVHDLLVTLEEVMHGCTKHVKVTRSRLSPEGHGLWSEEKVLNVVVKKGWRAGTRITFPREGDETPNSTPADITFILRDQEHPNYRRDGSNIVYTAKISLKEVSLENPAHEHLLFRPDLHNEDSVSKPPACNGLTEEQHPAIATVTSAAPAEREAKFSLMLDNPHGSHSTLPRSVPQTPLPLRGVQRGRGCWLAVALALALTRPRED